MPNKSGPRKRRPGHKQNRAGGRAATSSRQHFCFETARIMAEEGIDDYLQAKRKAARRLNLPETTPYPTNQEVQQALSDYLELFHRETTTQNLHKLRTTALQAMQLLQPYEPRLTGAVLEGVITKGTEIQLHLIADTAEEVAWFLMDHQIPYRESERRLRFGGDRYENLPTLRFLASTLTIELCIFTQKNRHEVPLSPVDGKPMMRATRQSLEQLLQQNDVAD